jgi:hypothetical protein
MESLDIFKNVKKYNNVKKKKKMLNIHKIWSSEKLLNIL